MTLAYRSIATAAVLVLGATARAAAGPEPGETATVPASAVSAAALPSCSADGEGHITFISGGGFRGSSSKMYGHIFFAGGGASRFQPSSNSGLSAHPGGGNGSVSAAPNPGQGGSPEAPPAEPPPTESGPAPEQETAPPAEPPPADAGASVSVGDETTESAADVPAAGEPAVTGGASNVPAGATASDATPAVTPEPATLLLIGAGLGSIAAFRRRRRARSKQDLTMLCALLSLAGAVGCSDRSFSSFFSSGEAYMAAGQYAEAAIQFENAARLDRESLAAQLKLGRSYTALDRREKAIAAYEHAVALDPRSTDARVGLAELYLQSARPDDSEQQLRALLDENVADPAATEMYGYLLEANECGQPPVGLLAMADYYIWSDRPDDALRVLDSLTGGDVAGAATARVAAILYDRGERSKAAQLASDLVTREPTNLDGLVLQGRIALDAGEIVRARQYVQKATALAPNVPAVRSLAAAVRATDEDVVGL